MTLSYGVFVRMEHFSKETLVLSRQWYILHYHRSTLLLPLKGEVVADGGRVEEGSKVIYCIERHTVIYYKGHNGHDPIQNTAPMTKTGVSGSSGC